MCPACIATAALITVGVTSAGGVTTIILKRRRQKMNAKSSFKEAYSKKHEHN